MKAPTIYVGVERVTPEDERLGANLLLATIRGTLAYGMAWGETAKRGDRLRFTTERERRGATVTLSARLMRLDDEGSVVSIFGSSHDSRPSARLGLPVRTTRLLPPGVVLAVDPNELMRHGAASSVLIERSKR